MSEIQAKSAAQTQTQALSEWAAGYLSEIGEGIKALNVKPEELTPEEFQALANELEAWRFNEKFPGDSLAQLRWTILEEKRRVVRTLISRIIISKVEGSEKRKITPILALELPQDLETSTTRPATLNIGLLPLKMHLSEKLNGYLRHNLEFLSLGLMGSSISYRPNSGQGY